MATIQATFDHLIRENPMGEARKDALRLDPDTSGLKLEFRGDTSLDKHTESLNY